MDQIHLTTSQKRSIQASLLTFERTLRNADRILSNGDENGIFYKRKMQLDQHNRQLIREKISQLLLDLADCRREFEMEAWDEYSERIIMFEMSASWESLEESRSKRLRGYGELDTPTAKKVDKAIDHFAQAALSIRSMINTLTLKDTPGRMIE